MSQTHRAITALTHAHEALREATREFNRGSIEAKSLIAASKTVMDIILGQIGSKQP